MPDFFEVAMFQAAVQKKNHLLPKPDQHTESISQPSNKNATLSEVTLVNDGNTSQSKQKDHKGSHPYA